MKRQVPFGVRLNSFYLYLAFYSTIYADLAFRVTEWVDSHDSLYFQQTYATRFGMSPDQYFSLSTVILFITLVLISGRKEILRSIMGTTAIFLSMIPAFLALQNTNPVLAWLLPRFAVAAVYSFTAVEDQWMFSIDNLPSEILLLEYEERVKALGYLVQAATVLLATGGLGFLITSLFETEPVWCVPATCIGWIVGWPLMLLGIAWGVFGVLVVRILFSMAALKQRLIQFYRVAKRQPPKHSVLRRSVECAGVKADS